MPFKFYGNIQFSEESDTRVGQVTASLDAFLKPDTYITREEAMIIMHSAMPIVGLKGSKSDLVYENYNDFETISLAGMNSVQEVISVNVFKGSGNLIFAKNYLTYAEAFQAIENLLIESEMINKKSITIN